MSDPYDTPPDDSQAVTDSSSGGFLSGFLNGITSITNTAASGYKTYLAATGAQASQQAAVAAANAKAAATTTWAKLLPMLAIGALLLGGGVVLWLFFKKK